MHEKDLLEQGVGFEALSGAPPFAGEAELPVADEFVEGDVRAFARWMAPAGLGWTSIWTGVGADQGAEFCRISTVSVETMHIVNALPEVQR